jgi:hypothetical protein
LGSSKKRTDVSLGQISVAQIRDMNGKRGDIGRMGEILREMRGLDYG